MDNFIVSARKYRPADFHSVVGQKSITTTLKNAIKNKHLAHAYLFCGPRGVGKTTCARIFSKTINCFHPTADFEACNQCESCKAFDENRSYNIHELDAASNNSVEDIRSLTDQVRIPPQIGSYSVYIIDEVHMLSTQAFNAFLKTLEEPPRHAIFVLATTEKHKILPTILSRCQIFDFNRITVEDAADYLAYVAKCENIEAEPEALNIIAQKADGAMRDALSFFDQVVSFAGNKLTYKAAIDNLNVLDYDYYFKLTDFFLNEKIADALLTFDEILDNGFDAQHFVTGIGSHFRDLMVCRNPETVKLLEVGAGIKEKYLEQAKKCSIDFLYLGLNIVAKCDVEYKSSSSKRLHVELALIELCYIITNQKKKSEELIKPVSEKSETVKNVQVNQNTSVEINPQVAVRKTSLARGSAMPSLRDAIEGKIPEQKEEIKAKLVDFEPVDVDANESFTIVQIQSAIKLFAEKIKDAKPRVSNGLISPSIQISGNKIYFFLPNLTLKDEIGLIYSELSGYVKSQIKNAKIELILEVKATEIQKPIFSQGEKLAYLIEKNAALQELKDVFKLDF